MTTNTHTQLYHPGDVWPAHWALPHWGLPPPKPSGNISGHSHLTGWVGVSVSFVPRQELSCPLPVSGRTLLLLLGGIPSNVCLGR
jgi:hypothetical protein